jgi:hypothetical protein
MTSLWWWWWWWGGGGGVTSQASKGHCQGRALQPFPSVNHNPSHPLPPLLPLQHCPSCPYPVDDLSTAAAVACCRGQNFTYWHAALPHSPPLIDLTHHPPAMEQTSVRYSCVTSCSHAAAFSANSSRGTLCCVPRKASVSESPYRRASRASPCSRAAGAIAAAKPGQPVGQATFARNMRRCPPGSCCYYSKGRLAGPTEMPLQVQVESAPRLIRHWLARAPFKGRVELPESTLEAPLPDLLPGLSERLHVALVLWDPSDRPSPRLWLQQIPLSCRRCC